jgi:class 3 adenylate cyclase
MQKGLAKKRNALQGLGLHKSFAGHEAAVCRRAHRVCLVCQDIIARNHGYRRQYLCDDKGTVMIAIFGVPPFAHEDDGYRAVKTALEIRAALLEIGIAHCIGVATGDVYVGSVGSPMRQEHAVVGDTVRPPIDPTRPPSQPYRPQTR